MFPQGLGFVLVFEYMLSDLGEIIANDANAAIASLNCCATKASNRGNFNKDAGGGERMIYVANLSYYKSN